MGALETAFAVVVTVLAAVCVVLALVVAAYWLLVQIGRLRAQLRPPEWWRDRGATAPTIPRKW
jgi:flagellar biogenesis protein FliO